MIDVNWIVSDSYLEPCKYAPKNELRLILKCYPQKFYIGWYAIKPNQT